MPSALTRFVDAGAREYHVLIQQLTEGQADSNFPTEAWTKLSTAWAARQYVTLDEVMKVDQLSASTVTEWTIPYMESMDPDRVDIAKTRRVVYMDRIYDILSARLSDRGAGRSIALTTLAKVG